MILLMIFFPFAMALIGAAAAGIVHLARCIAPGKSVLQADVKEIIVYVWHPQPEPVRREKPESFDRGFYFLTLFTTAAELAFALLYALSGDTSAFSLPGICGLGIRLAGDGFRRIYCVIIAFMWFMTMLFSAEYFRGHHQLSRYFFFQLMTLGAIMGVFFSEDLFTALIFFEIMSFTSFPWVIQEETDGAIRAANTYLAVAVIGGLAALMGLFLLYQELGTLTIAELAPAAASCPHKGVLYAAGACVLFGFGAKAGMFPLHIWLPKAHPVAPAPASALLSGVLTKSGVFGILAISCRLFRDDPLWGAIILGLGTVTMFLGAILALLSIDLKRTLACSSMSQIGFILIGVGMMGLLGRENALAARGALLHMVNHSLFKLVLFMCAGAVYMKLHVLDLNLVRGFGRGKHLLSLCFLLGAMGIAGVPGLNGYVSKTLLHESIVEGEHLFAGAAAGLLKAVEWIFLLSGGLTAAYMTKLYVCIFVEKPGESAKEAAAHGHAEASHNKEKTSGPESAAETAHTEAHSDAHAASGRRWITLPSILAIAVSTLLFPTLGLNANTLMNRLADLGTDFFSAGELEHAVHYFSLENLKGAGISLLIGALVYVFIVRKLLMKDGQYVEILKKRPDLEDDFYRPLLQKWLPGFFGAISAWFAENKVSAALFSLLKELGGKVSAWFADNRMTGAAYRGLKNLTGSVSEWFADNRVSGTAYRGLKNLTGSVSEWFADNRVSGAAYHFTKSASGTLTRGVSDTTDALIYVLRRTVFRNSPPPVTDSVHSSLSYRTGAFFDRVREKRGNAEPGSHRLAHRFYRFGLSLKEGTHKLTDTVSFALLMLCLAISAVLCYVLFLKH